MPVGVTVGSGQQYLSGCYPHAWCWTAQTGYKSSHGNSGGEAYGNNLYCISINQHLGPSWTTGDTVSVEVDLDAKTLEFFKNGESCGQAFTDVTGPIRFAFCGCNEHKIRIIPGGSASLQAKVAAKFDCSISILFRLVESIQVSGWLVTMVLIWPIQVYRFSCTFFNNNYISVDLVVSTCFIGRWVSRKASFINRTPFNCRS